MIKVTNRQMFIIGLLAIVLISALYNNLYFKEIDASRIPVKLKHLNKFILVILVYGTGTYVLKRIFTSWMIIIWHLIYMSTIFILIAVGFYYWWEGATSFELKRFANTLYDFLISPMPYVALGIVHYRILRHRLTR